MQITRLGYYTITGPDGQLLTKPDESLRQVTSRDEAYERITEDGRGGTFRIHCPDRRVEVDMALIVVAPPGPNYTATHYVAPFASVSGAVNDYADLGATSWSNATSVLTPTTMGTACARGVGGNFAQATPGVYTGLDYQNRNLACFPIAGGSTGNLFVLYAQYPGATNYGSNALYSEIRRPLIGDPSTGINASPLIAGTYAVVDGFYADEALAPCAPSSGMFTIAGTEFEYRRMAADRSESVIPYANDYNNNVFYFAETNYSGRVADCRVEGNCAYGGNPHNRSTIETYSAVNCMIENNTLNGNISGVYFKTNGSGASQNPDTIGTARYNKINAGQLAISYQRNLRLNIYQNITVVNGVEKSGLSYDAGNDDLRTDFNVYNNTVILRGVGANEEPYVAGIAFEAGTDFQGTFRDNLVYIESGTGEISMVSMPLPTTDDFSSFTQFDYNHYYRAAGTPEWHHNGIDYQTLAAWKLALSGMGAEQNSTYSNPTFVSYATDNFKLEVGSPALTSSSTGGPVGAYITGNEEIGVRANPTY